ncbi:hypothetical protein [Roseateles depolymerans]|uniref:Uncharacterized protein n=1 Tax=Roseateles depolymerans TaxID=76731 RepID=A0A0U3N4C8_9BURK|nr:hypothetical protein [Roseateles depolymerans]ALV07067.1 hypothetical protein RD2015_2602 [Roseateles depolymerans]REG20050.1 hypothetical protein DES44_2556 [Roseateles depolymerans]
MKINGDRVERLQRTDETRSTHQAQSSGVQAWVDQSPRMTAQRALISAFTPASSPVQRMLSNHQPPETNLAQDRLNIVGENHPESDARRADEIEHCARLLGWGKYWVEGFFPIPLAGGGFALGDPPFLRFYNILFIIKPFDFITGDLKTDFNKIDQVAAFYQSLLYSVTFEAIAAVSAVDMYAEFEENPGDHLVTHNKVFELKEGLHKDLGEIRSLAQKTSEYSVTRSRYRETIEDLNDRFADFNATLNAIGEFVDEREVDQAEKFKGTCGLRSLGMAEAANLANAPKSGVWKVGQAHIDDMLDLPVRTFKLISRDDYNLELAAFKAYWSHPTLNTQGASSVPPESE